MDPASLAAIAVSTLGLYLTKGLEEFAKTAGKDAYEGAKHLLATLKKHWAGDPIASDYLERFEKKPDAYAAGLEDILKERLDENGELKSRIEDAIKQIGPRLDIIVKMSHGEDVTGIKAKEFVRGQAKVTVDVDQGKGVRGADVERIG